MKVLVNGCSHIAGDELDDDHSRARELTWPNFMQDWQVVNIAQGGSSNDSICRRTMIELERNDYDLVYIQWTHFPRIELQIPNHQLHGLADQDQWFCIHSQDAVRRGLLSHNPDLIYDIAQHIFAKQFDWDWFRIYNLNQLVVLQQYLTHRQQPYWFGFADDEIFHVQDPRRELLDSARLIQEPWMQFCQDGNYSKIGSHYGLAAHRDYSKHIEQKLYGDRT